MAFATTGELGTYLGETLTGARLTQASLHLDLATAQIQGWTRQTLELVEDDTITLVGTQDWELELPQLPVAEATVDTIDGVAPVPGSYRLSGATLIRPGGWIGPGYPSATWPAYDPYYTSAVQVTYTHGYDPIPDDIKLACLQLAARVLQSPTGIRQEQVGAYSVTYGGDVPGGALTAAETSLLGRYRRRGAAVVLR